MKAQLYPASSEVVRCAIDGFLLSNAQLARLDGFDADIKVVVNSNIDKSKVAVIAGGGSGHEGAHAGYVGRGMLSAAVCGEVFASPSVDAVYAAIKHCTGPAGCLLIVKNYTGDRLNFGLAAELAKQDGIQCAMVIVGDDAALESGHTITGRRGLAGTVIVEKLAGALAESGASLAEVARAASDAAARVATAGLSLSVCTLPHQPPSTRLAGGGQMEVGLGIHGEPGHATETYTSASASVARLYEIILASGYLDLAIGAAGEPRRVALMVNNLGSTTPLELAAVTREAVAQGQARGLEIERVYSGPFMTSLDMHGISLTLFRIDTETDLHLLDASHSAPSWPMLPSRPVAALPAPRPCVVTAAADPASLTGGAPVDAAKARAWIRVAMEAVLACEAEVTAADTLVGDGDCGLTHTQGARAILMDLESGSSPLMNPADLVSLFSGLRGSVRRSMGGSSGALYNICLAAAAAAAKASTENSLVTCLREGVEAMMRYGGAQEGDRTLLDALAPALRALQSAGGGVDPAAAALAAKAATEGAEKTKAMKARAGRSSYVPDAVLRSTPDPGAIVVASVFRALAAWCAVCNQY